MTPFADLWPEWREAYTTLGLNVPGLNAPLDPHAFEQAVERFYEDLLAYNEKVNLTRITVPEDFLYRHVLDALIFSPRIPENATVIDLGSGGGFPAIPLVLARPDIRLTAVDSVAKKTRFLSEVREALSLQDRLTVVTERAEVLGQDRQYRDRFHVATSRALAKLPVLLELCVPLIKPGGTILAMKGKKTVDAEIQSAGAAFKLLRSQLEERVDVEHPKLEGSVLLVIRKKGVTPAIYPRKAGEPTHKPL